MFLTDTVFRKGKEGLRALFMDAMTKGRAVEPSVDGAMSMEHAGASERVGVWASKRRIPALCLVAHWIAAPCIGGGNPGARCDGGSSLSF